MGFGVWDWWLKEEGDGVVQVVSAVAIDDSALQDR